jgi:enoyl-CoA hydratase
VPLQVPAFQQINYSVFGRVAVVSLNRPRVANAVSRLMTRELSRAFEIACDDDRVRCILLRSEGRHFSSGHDLGSAEHFADTAFPQELDPSSRGDYLKWDVNDVEACLRWRRLRKPIVCALRGYCIYHGTVVASCADVVLAADDLRYMPSLVEANLFPWAAGLQPQRIKHILFTQRFVLAPEALEVRGVLSPVAHAAKQLFHSLAHNANVAPPSSTSTQYTCTSTQYTCTSTTPA